MLAQTKKMYLYRYSNAWVSVRNERNVRNERKKTTTPDKHLGRKKCCFTVETTRH